MKICISEINRPGGGPFLQVNSFFSLQRQRQTHCTSENTNEKTNISGISRPGVVPSFKSTLFSLCKDKDKHSVQVKIQMKTQT